ncbi:hypothetical protein HYFRA_00006538 [Hymenoscyphus fraxineus]|uniref:Uncharacterized protein n=1 Tax=Hymenoscyphus fraxineus TaxID=746836 RepID=A0A9N9PPK6_9HELO|nr:hypothetical protein HYFRA_00006538 [Hymenoscyphus fraxineus]
MLAEVYRSLGNWFRQVCGSLNKWALNRNSQKATTQPLHCPDSQEIRLKPFNAIHLVAMNNDDGSPLFAFQDIDYIPFGFSTSLAPYIPTPASTMRAAATLMRLIPEVTSIKPNTKPVVVCDLGSGDGDFHVGKLKIPQTPELTHTSQVIGLLSHINKLNSSDIVAANGVGVDYDAALIDDAGLKSKLEGVDAKWLVYDFNADENDIVTQLVTTHLVTHVFIYLTPKQLALPTVRKILTRFCGSGMVVCCYKYFPLYLKPVSRDLVMDLVVFDETS